MNAMSRRKIEMGTRALEFSRANPDTDAGYGVAAAKLAQLVGQAEQLAAAQRDGLIERVSAPPLSDQLRRSILNVPIAHLAQVVAWPRRRSTKWKTFRFKPASNLARLSDRRRGVWRPRRRPIAKCW